MIDNYLMEDKSSSLLDDITYIERLVSETSFSHAYEKEDDLETTIMNELKQVAD